MNLTEIDIDLGSVTITCTGPEIGRVFGGLLREMRRMAPRLRGDEVDALREVMRHESGTLTVGELFPEFERESEYHMTLRRLRAAQFIRPGRTGRWEADEPIEVKPFTQLVWDRLGEGSLFPRGDLDENALSDETPTPGEHPPATWDDNVLDLGDFVEEKRP
ncbi:unnamed protein product [Gemmataceae bacterium]|jgi:hypothetical protein|nr:unnamed protein product [Gemmataceae bacterium]VTT97371.1 unnamed protein product [Gemmataceae bacterium]